jgi:peroxiredoxin
MLYGVHMRGRGVIQGLRGSQTGKPAIPFELPDADGRLHRLADYQGHWLLLVFHRHLG